MTAIKRLLIANRGEIAVRVARAAAELGIETVGVFSEDDSGSPHLQASNARVALPGRGAASYLNIAAIVAAACDNGCDAVHPGYGFLSENAELAEACAASGLIFVGPSPQTLRLFGDKAAARGLALELGVPLLPGTTGAVTLAEARDFLASLGPGGAMMLKAVSGGGGRGMRVVTDLGDVEDAFQSCAAEAGKAFGDDKLYVEQLVRRARHLEIQVIGDGSGSVVHLGERECTLQRRHQKLIEIAPSPGLSEDLRSTLCAAACQMASRVSYSGLCTFEFLVDADGAANYWFMEANPRVQVEHTITEEITRIDLVQTQLLIAAGATLKDLGLTQDKIAPQGMAMQLRLNAELIDEGGQVRPTSGLVSLYEMPSGPGVRIDGYIRSGHVLNPSFDSLLSKLIILQRGEVKSGTYLRLLERGRRALSECRIAGVATNIAFLSALLEARAVRDDAVYTRFVEDEWEKLLNEARTIDRASEGFAATKAPAEVAINLASAPPGALTVAAPMTGMLARVFVSSGDVVAKGEALAIVEAMKMEHALHAPCSGVISMAGAVEGALVAEGVPLLFLEPDVGEGDEPDAVEAIDLEAIPPLLADELERRRLRMDEARPQAVASRRKASHRTLRENIAALCDPGTFVEYGGLALPSQRQRRSYKQLVALGPADGFVSGKASINAEILSGADSGCFVMGYDYTAFAGTQGWANHKKLGRMLGIAAKQPRPIVIFTEGGGGRPGETDQMRASGLDNTNFANFARLSGRVPLVGIVSGRCFAGNAALLGCCDVIIATPDATIGMGGPAMIEGGGLGVFAPEEVGPVSMQVPNGVIDLLAADDEDAVSLAKKYLSYFQGPVSNWTSAEQHVMRHLVPENRLRTYDVRRVIETLIDESSGLELRPEFGRGLITTLARIEGRPCGVIANDTRHLAGALDSTSADKAARFLRLCELFRLPVISLCDTPGFMVGPDSERTAAVRRMSRMFLAGANLTVPLITVVLRKGFGLGAMAMAGGGMHETVLTLAWPTAQFGAMGLEGAVRLGYRRELEAAKDHEEREALFAKLVAQLYEDGKAHNAAGFVEIDDVIDPADTRSIVARTLEAKGEAAAPCLHFLDSW